MATVFIAGCTAATFSDILWLVSKNGSKIMMPGCCDDPFKLLPSHIFLALLWLILIAWKCIKCPDLKIFAIVGAQWKIVGWSKEKLSICYYNVWSYNCSSILKSASEASDLHRKLMPRSAGRFPLSLLHFRTISRQGWQRKTHLLFLAETAQTLFRVRTDH